MTSRAQLLNILEDFDIVGTLQYFALIERSKYTENFKDNVRAAAIASTLHLKSIDYAKKEYLTKEENDNDDDEKLKLLYIDAYTTAKNHVSQSISKLNNASECTAGVFGASLVLQRLEESFFCVHFLFILGKAYEGYAVARLILEQIAWASAAYKFNDIDDIRKIITTKSISELKKLIPNAGKLYNFLSDKTHIDYSNHSEFLKIIDGKGMVVLGDHNFLIYGKLLLRLADIFTIVWECSQYDFLQEFTSVKKENGNILINEDRELQIKIKDYEQKINNLSNNSLNRVA
ncbi:MAG: hypothetical protein V4525_03765 [Pseudomonadota bacterium]